MQLVHNMENDEVEFNIERIERLGTAACPKSITFCSASK
jgi:hypothetical protein